MNVHPYETQNGTRYRVRYKRPDGRWTSKRGFTRRADAKAWMDKQNVDIRDGSWVDPRRGKVTVGELGKVWLAGRTDVKPSYLHSLQAAWRMHVEPRWGRVAISDVTFADVQEWVSGIDRSATVVRRNHGILNAILADAVRDRRLPSNPCAGVRLPRRERTEHRYLTRDELVRLADASKQHRTLVLVLGFTGLRWGEATALRVRDFNPGKGRFTVARNAVKVGNEIHIGTPKTHRSRTVPVPPAVGGLVLAECEGKGPDDLLFTSRAGGVLKYPANERRTWWAAATKRAGVEGLRRHDLRHTAASLAVASGANVKAVQSMLGHASAAMTLDVYADLFDDHLDDVAGRMNDGLADLLGQNPNERGPNMGHERHLQAVETKKNPA